MWSDSSIQYSVNKNIRVKTSMLRPDLCNYSDAYIVLKRTIAVNVLMMLTKEIKS